MEEEKSELKPEIKPATIKKTELTRTEQTIYNLKGKYIKQTLMRMEEEKTISPLARKAVLDGFNDYCRELLGELGYDYRR